VGGVDDVDAVVGAAQERPLPAEVEPGSQGRVGFQGLEKHFFMISQEGDQAAAPGEPDQLVDDGAAVRPVIDVVAERHDRIVGSGSGFRGPSSSRGCRRWRRVVWSWGRGCPRSPFVAGLCHRGDDRPTHAAGSGRSRGPPRRRGCPRSRSARGRRGVSRASRH